MTCRYSDWDGSYVLGALSPRERLEFEEHLDTCTACARAVRELAGLPGLLAQVDPSVLERPEGDVPLPDTLLPALLAGVRRSRRRTLTTAGLAAAAAVLVAALPVGLAVRHDGGTSPAPPPGAAAVPDGRPMAVLGHAPVRAELALQQVAWGTRLDLTCTYAPDPDRYHLPASVTYVLFVRTHDGRSEQVGTWRSLRGTTMRLTAATAANRSAIASVEVRTTDGLPVLRLGT